MLKNMKKVLVVLILCLTTSYQAFSQTRSTNSSEDCVVPCESLRKALIMKEDKKLLEGKFQIAKDSIKILSEVVELQKNLIDNKDKEISLFKDNQTKQQNIITEKDKQIVEYKKVIRKQKVFKLIGFGSGFVGVAAVALLLL